MDFQSTGKGFKKCFLPLCIFKNQAFLGQYRMRGRINLNIRSDQHIISYDYFPVVYKCTVHIDDHVAADKNIFSVITMKRNVNGNIFSYSPQCTGINT